MDGTLLASFSQAGGPFVWPIAGCLAVLLALVLERSWTCWRMRGDAEIRRVLDRVDALVAEHGISRRLDEYCNTIGRLEGCVLSECLSCCKRVDRVGGARRSSRREIERVAFEATYNYLHRYLSVVVSLAQAATLLGLLGTLLGVLVALGAVSRGGVIETASANAGLTEALLTAAVGAIVAASAIWFYVHCDRRADRKMSDFAPARMAIVEALTCQDNRVT